MCQRERVPVASVPEWGPLPGLRPAEKVRVCVPLRVHRDALRAGTAGLGRTDAVQGLYHRADRVRLNADT